MGAACAALESDLWQQAKLVKAPASQPCAERNWPALQEVCEFLKCALAGSINGWLHVLIGSRSSL